METTELTHFLELCLLCTCAPNPVQPHIDINSDIGNEHNLLEKIHTHLTIKVVQGLPQVVCHDCIYKLEVCHELVQCSEEAHIKLLGMKGQWDTKVKTEPLDYDGETHESPPVIEMVYSLVDASDIKIEETSLLETESNSNDCYVNSSESKGEICITPLKIKVEPVESNDTMETETADRISDISKSDTDDGTECFSKSPELLLICKNEVLEGVEKNPSLVENLEIEVDPTIFEESNTNISFEVDPIMETSSHMILGSQLAFFYADYDEKCVYPIVHHVLINIDEETGHDKYQMLEKISRVGKQCKSRVKFLQEHFKMQHSWMTRAMYHCHTCKYSFYMRQEMGLHFESLHPDQVRLCVQCNKNIYGYVSCPEQISLCHLHDLDVSSKFKRLKYDPEFLVIPLGQLEKHNESEALRLMLRLNSIVGNQLIRSDMKPKIWVALKNFILCNETHPRNTSRISEYSRIQCHFCMKLMSKRAMRSHIKLHLSAQFNNGITLSKDNKIIQALPAPRIQDIPNHTSQQASHSLSHPHRAPPFLINNAVMTVCCHCKKTFRNISLALHIEIAHFGGKNLMCRVCDEQYEQTGVEQPHMMTMSCQRYKCPYESCKRGYLYKTLLKAHIKICHPHRRVLKTPVECDLCGRTFKGKGFIARHIKLAHFKGVT